MMDVSQAHELKLAFRRNGWSNAQIKRLCEGKLLGDVLDVIRGLAEIKKIEYAVDCSTPPFIPDGLYIDEHREEEIFIIDPTKGPCDLTRKQKDKSSMGVDIRNELRRKKIMNVNVLDYLIENPELIPEKWNDKLIYFWGTVYKSSCGQLHLPCLDTRKNDVRRVYGFVNKPLF